MHLPYSVRSPRRAVSLSLSVVAMSLGCDGRHRQEWPFPFRRRAVRLISMRRRLHDEILMETRRVIRFRCKSFRYEWYAEHGNVERDRKPKQ